MSSPRALAACGFPGQASGMRYTLVRMVTLAEIESSATRVSPAEKREPMLFVASRPRAEGAAARAAYVYVGGDDWMDCRGWIGYAPDSETDVRRFLDSSVLNAAAASAEVVIERSCTGHRYGNSG
jgi:hypothetical protein